MSGCISTACTQECANPCPIAALTDRLDALEKTVKDPGLWGWAKYLVDNAASLVLLIVTAFALIALFIWLSRGGMKSLSNLAVKSASLSTTGAEITFESAAKQVSAMMDAMQDYVVQDAALITQFRALAKAGSTDLSADAVDNAVERFLSVLPALRLAANAGPNEAASAPWRQTSFSSQPPKQDLAPLSILWVQETAESRAFERKVIETMDNRIETRIGTAAATARLLTGALYDLVVIEDAALGTEEQGAGLELALNLVHGTNTPPGVGNPRRVQAGKEMRLALWTASADLEDRKRQVKAAMGTEGSAQWSGLEPHILVTDEFLALRRSIRWLQIGKAALKQDKA